MHLDGVRRVILARLQIHYPSTLDAVYEPASICPISGAKIWKRFHNVQTEFELNILLNRFTLINLLLLNVNIIQLKVGFNLVISLLYIRYNFL